jgi:hypothetical protein
MTEDASPFPPGYAKRWRHRCLFGAQRFGLTEARRQAAMKGVVAHVTAAARESFVTSWLFFRLRPWDLLPVARRQLRYVIERSLAAARRLVFHCFSPSQPSNPANWARR